ncbi:MAG: helix-turn-helix domain-containing protein [Defluviitaleaceae bacterium]|nr:helix-turn-helix domain-containing protein [Defluviitaleaceae bacterium]
MENYKDWLTSFGANLRAERERQGITRVILAERIGTKPDYISQMERGDKAPSMRTLLNVLTALNVSPNFLLSDSGKTQDEQEEIVNNFTEFLRQLDAGVVASLYEIVRFSSKYIKSS